jgi:hypothetical protein
MASPARGFSLCAKLQKPLNPFMLATIGRLAFFASGGLLGLFALVYEPPLRPDHAGYRQCVQLHPQRYCSITFLNKR